MPIYAYKCSACGHAKDVLQKVSDQPLDTCPECGAHTFAKQVTTAGFHLKGSGWYSSDFKGGASSAGAAAESGSSTEAAPASGGGSCCGGCCGGHQH